MFGIGKEWKHALHSILENIYELKSTIANNVKPGHPRPKFVLFTTWDTEKNLVWYMLHGMSTLPRSEFKFKSQISYSVNVNDFLYIFMGTKVLRIENKCRCLFGVYNPRLTIPSRKVKINHKLETFFNGFPKCVQRQDNWVVNFLWMNKQLVSKVIIETSSW